MQGIRNKLIYMVRTKHNAGPMKDKRMPRGGQYNAQRDYIVEYEDEQDDGHNEDSNECWD